MIKSVLCLVCIVILSAGCLKHESGCSYSPASIVAPAAEQKTLTDYLAANQIVATKDSSGMYYQVITPGSANISPVLCSQIQIKYSGKLINGTVFDHNDNAFFVLGSLIEGWKRGIPLIQKGGQIRLYIPPTLGYGSSDIKDNTTGQVVIPGNSILIFDITLIDYTAG